MGVTRVIQYGVGAMGSNMVRLLNAKKDVKVVGAIDRDDKKIGHDLGDLIGLGHKMGVIVQYPPERVLNNVAADLVLHSTTARMDEALPQVLHCVAMRMNVVTIAQELFFPLGENKLKAELIDKKAKETGVSVTATGINPGFIMDIVPIVCSLPCWEIKKVRVRRVVDFSPYGPTEMRQIGAGLSPPEFMHGVRDGVVGHVGLLETAAMIDHCLGLGIEDLTQRKEPVISQTERRTEFITISAGKVCGFKQEVVGLREKEEVLNLTMMGLVAPDMGETAMELGDHARIEGVPNVDIRVKEEIAQKGGLGTAGAAVNVIPLIMEASPGFHPMYTLPLPHVWAHVDKKGCLKVNYIM